MNRKIRISFMMVFLLAGLTARAQFTGGDGRGDIMVAPGLTTLDGPCLNPDDGGTIAADQTICYGTTPDPFTNDEPPLGHIGDLEYLWQMNTESANASFELWEDLGVFTETATYDHAGTVTQTTWFRRLARVTCEPVGWASATASNVVEVTVDPLPTASAGGSATICENDSHQVSGASAEHGTIKWTHNGAGSLDNDETLTPTYNGASGDAGKTVTLTMTVTSNNECGPATATAYYTIHVGSFGPATRVNIRASNAPNGQVKFTATPVNGGDNPTYQWYKNGKKIDGETGNVLIDTCKSGDEHWVEMTSSIPCTALATSNAMCTY